jgi:tetratricopeptide (TPR) repeat protein
MRHRTVRLLLARALAAVCLLSSAAAAPRGQDAKADSFRQDSGIAEGRSGKLWDLFNLDVSYEQYEIETKGLSFESPADRPALDALLKKTWGRMIETANLALKSQTGPNFSRLEDPFLVMAYTQYQLGRYAEAAAWYTKAQAAGPLPPAAHFNLALAYYRLGRAADAQRELTQAVRVQPQYASRANYRALSATLGSAPPAAAPKPVGSPAVAAAPEEPSKEVPLGVLDLDMPSKGIAGGLLHVEHFEVLNGVLVAFARLTGRVSGVEVDERLKLPVEVTPYPSGLSVSYHYPALSSMRRLGFSETMESLKYDPAPGDRAAWYPEAARTLIRETQLRLWKEKNPPADWLAQRLNQLAQLLAHPPR